MNCRFCGQLDSTNSGECPRCAPHVGIVREWHSPHNDSCEHNANVAHDCTCKRKVTRKGFKTVRVNARNVPRGVKPQLVIEIHDGGRLVFRELRRRVSYDTTIGDVYFDLMTRAARREAATKRKRK